MIGGERERQLIDAVCAAFEPGELRAVVELVDPRLADRVAWGNAKQLVVEDMFRAAGRSGADCVEALVRSARRARSDSSLLSGAVQACWGYAGKLAPTTVDDLVSALVTDGVALDELERLATRTARPLPVLRSERGREALADLVERLAGHPARPGGALPLFQFAAELRRAERAAVIAWVARHCPTGPTSTAVPTGSTRMLIVLYPEDNDDYSVEVFLSNAAGLPQQVAVLDRASLAGIPARICEQLVPGTRLFEAMHTSEIEQIDVMLPLRDVLAAVDEWTLHGHALSIGETYRVVVRCLERNLTRRFPEFVLARQKASMMWRELHTRRGCAVHWIEAAEQLTPHQLRNALRQLAVKKWLVAAVCADAPAADRRLALELMIRQGVPAALTLRGTAAAPARPLLEPACAELSRLPASVHEHRATASLPVTLLWDDPDFRPEEWR